MTRTIHWYVLLIFLAEVQSDGADLARIQNWPLRKKIIIFLCICLAGFAGQMSPNSNQLTFILQIPTYHKTQADLLNSVAAALAGWVAGPFLVAPFAALIRRTSVIFGSLIATFACQIWAGEMTGPDDFMPFTVSGLFCGIFGVIPAILGSGYIIDMFYLHQRGKAFAIFEVLIIFAVVGGGTLGGYIAETKPWDYVFWWTLGPVGAAIICVFLFVEDTTFNRGLNGVRYTPLPKSWVALPIVSQPSSLALELNPQERVKNSYVHSKYSSITMLRLPDLPSDHPISNHLDSNHPSRRYVRLHRVGPSHLASLHSSHLSTTPSDGRRIWLLAAPARLLHNDRLGGYHWRADLWLLLQRQDTPLARPHPRRNVAYRVSPLQHHLA